MKDSIARIFVRLGFILGIFCVSCTGLTVDQVGSSADQKYSVGVANQIDDSCSYYYFLVAKSVEFDQRYEEALEAYEKVLACDPDNDTVIRDMAILLAKMDRKQEAVGWLKKAVARDPDDIGSRMLLARLFSSMGNIKEAIEVYNYILEKKEDENSLLMLGSLYARDKQYDKTREVLQRVINLNDASYMGYYALARLHRELGDFKKTAVSYEKSLNLNWSVVLAYEVAEFYEQQKKFSKAIGLYKKIIEEDETEYPARTRLISMYLVSGQDAIALVELQKLKELVPDHKGLDLNIGRILMTQKKYDEVISLLAPRLAEEEEGDSDARFMSAQAYYLKGEPTKAKELLGVISPEARAYEDAILSLVRIMHDEDDLDNAIDFLKEKIADPGTRRLSFYVVLSSMCREEKRTEEGLDILEKALREYPDNAELLFEYGMFLERTGDQAGAFDKMQQVLALEPENGPALNYVGYTWAEKGVNLKKALEYIEKAISLNPDDGYIRDSLGWVYFKLGDIERAVTELEKAVKSVAGDPVIHEHLADVYLRANRPKDALRTYKKGFKLYTEKDKKEMIQKKIEDLKKSLSVQEKKTD